MKKYLIISASLFLLASKALPQGGSGEGTNYVNPIIGTNGMGHTFPGACS